MEKSNQGANSSASNSKPERPPKSLSNLSGAALGFECKPWTSKEGTPFTSWVKPRGEQILAKPRIHESLLQGARTESQAEEMAKKKAHRDVVQTFLKECEKLKSQTVPVVTPQSSDGASVESFPRPLTGCQLPKTPPDDNSGLLLANVDVLQRCMEKLEKLRSELVTHRSSHGASVASVERLSTGSGLMRPEIDDDNCLVMAADSSASKPRRPVRPMKKTPATLGLERGPCLLNSAKSPLGISPATLDHPGSIESQMKQTLAQRLEALCFDVKLEEEKARKKSPVTDRRFEEVLVQLTSRAADLDRVTSDIVLASQSDPSQVCTSVNRFRWAFEDFMYSGLNVVGMSKNSETQTQVVSALLRVCVVSREFLMASKSHLISPYAPNAMNQLMEAARAVTESVKYLISVCTVSTSGLKEFENALRQIQAHEDILRSFGEERENVTSPIQPILEHRVTDGASVARVARPSRRIWESKPHSDDNTGLLLAHGCVPQSLLEERENVTSPKSVTRVARPSIRIQVPKAQRDHNTDLLLPSPRVGFEESDLSLGLRPLTPNASKLLARYNLQMRIQEAIISACKGCLTSGSRLRVSGSIIVDIDGKREVVTIEIDEPLDQTSEEIPCLC